MYQQSETTTRSLPMALCLLLCIGCSFFSCKKDSIHTPEIICTGSCITVEGLVIDGVSGQPVRDFPLRLWALEQGVFTFFLDHHLITDFCSDSLGNYQISVPVSQFIHRNSEMLRITETSKNQMHNFANIVFDHLADTTQMDKTITHDITVFQAAPLAIEIKKTAESTASNLWVHFNTPTDQLGWQKNYPVKNGIHYIDIPIGQDVTVSWTVYRTDASNVTSGSEKVVASSKDGVKVVVDLK